MSGSIPMTHQRSVGGMPYIVVTASHAGGISIVVTVPGIGPEEACDRAYVNEAEALLAADGIARVLIHQCAILTLPN